MANYLLLYVSSLAVRNGPILYLCRGSAKSSRPLALWNNRHARLHFRLRSSYVWMSVTLSNFMKLSSFFSAFILFNIFSLIMQVTLLPRSSISLVRCQLSTLQEMFIVDMKLKIRWGFLQQTVFVTIVLLPCWIFSWKFFQQQQQPHNILSTLSIYNIAGDFLAIIVLVTLV